MSNRRNTRNKRCPYCRININFCFCEGLSIHQNRTPVSVIMHFREKHLTSNTANLGLLTLSKFQIYERGLKDSPFSFSSIPIGQDERVLFLYPGEGAVLLDDEFTDKYKGPYHLIVPDGSWSQASNIRKREGLDHLLAVKLPPDLKGGYTLRKSTSPNRLSTFEAVAYALKFLEGEELSQSLLSCFKLMNERFEHSRKTSAIIPPIRMENQ